MQPSKKKTKYGRISTENEIGAMAGLAALQQSQNTIPGVAVTDGAHDPQQMPSTSHPTYIILNESNKSNNSSGSSSSRLQLGLNLHIDPLSFDMSEMVPTRSDSPTHLHAGSDAVDRESVYPHGANPGSLGSTEGAAAGRGSTWDAGAGGSEVGVKRGGELINPSAQLFDATRDLDSVRLMGDNDARELLLKVRWCQCVF